MMSSIPYRHSLSIVIFCLFQIYSLFGQNTTYFFNRLTKSDGLLLTKPNLYIKKDQKGFIWISSRNGWSRYDGKTFKNYSANKGSFTSGTTVTSDLHEDQKGNFWFSTNNSLQYYQTKQDRFQRLNILCGGEDCEAPFYLVKVDTLQNLVWFRERDTLYNIPLDTSRVEANRIGLFSLNIRSKIVSFDSKQLVITAPAKENGLLVYNSSDGKSFGPPDHYLKNFNVVDFLIEDEETCWVGTEEGLVLLNLKDGSYQTFEYFIDLKIENLRSITNGQTDDLIVATVNNGIFFFDKVRQQFTSQIYRYNGEEVFPFTPVVEVIHMNQDGTLWVSTQGEGLFFTNLKKKRFNAVLQKRRMASNIEECKQYSSDIRSITEDKYGNIWCLTAKGIAITDSKGNEYVDWTNTINCELTLDAESNYFIYCDNENNIWATDQKGVYLLADGAKTFKKVALEQQGTNYSLTFTCIRQLSNDRILLSSVEGVYEGVKEENTYILRKVIKGSARYSWIHELKAFNLILIKNIDEAINLYDYDYEVVAFQRRIEIFPFVNYLVEDKKRACIWIATSVGLHRIDIDDFNTKSFNIKKDSSISSLVNSVLIDGKGVLWMGTNEGLIEYYPETKQQRKYSIQDGIQAEEFNFWSAHQLTDGKMAFGGSNGINLFYPKEVKALETKIKPIISTIRLNDMPPEKPLVCLKTNATNIPYLKSIKLSKTHDIISFRFSALDYSDPDANLYRYRLVNRDKDWVYSGNENFARYDELAHGKYLFQVQATNSDGVWSNSITTLQIIKPPPIYLAPWFIISTIILTVVLLYGGIRLRFNQLKRKLQTENQIANLQKQEAELKLAAAELKQSKAELETSVLRLQMDPHFLFNAMNAIASFIQNESTEIATQYTRKFASVMRMILDNSEAHYTSIDEEIDLIKLYLDTESIRKQGRLSYQITVDSMIDTESIEIPTMILQPFVENAIKHGISPTKENHILIQIRFLLEKEMLLCEVEDNGVGRALSHKKNKNHRSKALSITKKRLALLSEETSAIARYEIQDLHDAHQQPSGTLIRLFLPLLD